jgi:hypothetical protein
LLLLAGLGLIYGWGCFENSRYTHAASRANGYQAATFALLVQQLRE